ncbi:MAG: ABC transporter ATP-binding protein [Candidatus Bathyarchaeia archaeon]
MLEVKNLNVFRGKIQVLWNVSIEVKKGEVTSIIGANGAGKTTLLSAIVGLLKPTSGKILFRGKEINDLTPYQINRLGISLVPEDKRLFINLTVKENLILGANSPRAKAKKEETLKMVYQLFPVLKSKEKQVAATLSGGEQRMLALSRGLMSNPDLLILDEPSQGLAPKMIREIFSALEKLRSYGLSMLLAEQNVYYALNFASKAYVIETGRVTLSGRGSELLKNDYVKKAFLGL